MNEDSEEAGGQEAVPAGDQGHVVHTGVKELPGQSPCYVLLSEGEILIKSQWRGTTSRKVSRETLTELAQLKTWRLLQQSPLTSCNAGGRRRELSCDDDFDCIGPDPAGHTGRRGGDSHWFRGRRLETGECSMCQYRLLNIIYNFLQGFLIS